MVYKQSLNDKGIKKQNDLLLYSGFGEAVACKGEVKSNIFSVRSH